MNWSGAVSKLKTIAGIAHGSRAFGGPVQASLMLTNRCNIRCIHCYFYSPLIDQSNLGPLRRTRKTLAERPPAEATAQAQQLHADPSMIRRVLDELLQLGTRRFQFSGNGEVFLHESSLELMRRAKQAGAYCLANTNGTLLLPRLADELLAMRFDELRVTVMGGTAEMYSRTHSESGSETFNRVRDNLLYFSEKKKAKGCRRPRIILVDIVADQNCDGLVDFAEFCVRVGADGALFKPVDDLNDPSMFRLVPTVEHAALVRKQLGEVRVRLEAHEIRHNVDRFLAVFGRKLDTAELYRRIPCYYGWLSSMIEPDGTVYPCCRCYEAMGNVCRTSFTEIWNSERYRQYREQAGRINRLQRPPENCDCGSCVHHEANFRVYKALHPLRSREVSRALPDALMSR